MWIAIRLLLAAAGFLLRQLSPALKTPAGESEGVPFHVKTHGSEQRISALTLGMPVRSTAWIRFYREGAIDRFAKLLGLARELQTGDARFDDKIYVACDHPRALELIAASKELRQAVRRALELGAQRVRYDGQAVWLDRISGTRVSERHLAVLRDLVKASAPLQGEPRSWHRDRFLWRVLLVESVIWSIAGYAIGAVLGMAAAPAWHWYHGRLLLLGGVAAGALFAALLVLCALLLRGSSRGHRVLVESALVLLLSLPAAGLQLAGDTNRALDDSAPLRITAAVRDCTVSTYKRREKYFVVLDGAPASSDTPAVALPEEIKAEERVCREAARTRTLELVVGPGRWGVPWLRELRAGGARWALPR